MAINKTVCLFYASMTAEEVVVKVSFYCFAAAIVLSACDSAGESGEFAPKEAANQMLETLGFARGMPVDGDKCRMPSILAGSPVIVTPGTSIGNGNMRAIFEGAGLPLDNRELARGFYYRWKADGRGDPKRALVVTSAECALGADATPEQVEEHSEIDEQQRRGAVQSLVDAFGRVEEIDRFFVADTALGGGVNEELVTTVGTGDKTQPLFSFTTVERGQDSLDVQIALQLECGNGFASPVATFTLDLMQLPETDKIQ